MIKDMLQGKPIGHPLHPALVHFPIGLFFLSLLLDVVRLLGAESEALEAGAFYSMAGGIVTALLAAIPGLADWTDIRADHPAKKTANVHMILNLVAVAVYGFSLWWRYAGGTDGISIGLSVVGFGLLSISGYLGGSLVYEDGIAVGRHRRPHPNPRETLLLDTLDAGDDYVEIPEAARLKDGETVRAEIRGKVIAIARSEGRYFAIQEFCTHRFGPLSEGQIADGRVMCPWHRSCFDLRTGKVVEGPAKLDLLTYEVSVDDGRVRVRIPPQEITTEKREAA